MKQIIENNFERILRNFILLQPVIDFIASILIHCWNVDFKLGMIIRIAFLVLTMFSTVFVYKKKNCTLYYLITGFYFLIFMITMANFNKNINLLSEFTQLIEVFYLPILMISFYNLKNEINISKKWIISSLKIYIVLFLASLILNIGFNHTKLDVINKQNTILLSILTPFFLSYVSLINGNIKKIIITFVYMFIIFKLQMLIPIVCFLFTGGLFFIHKIITNIKSKNIKKISFICALATISTISAAIIVSQHNGYKNTDVDIKEQEIKNINSELEKKESIKEILLEIDTNVLNEKKETYRNSSLYRKIIGIGYHNDKEQTKMIKNDYLDLYYSNGIIGTLLFFAPLFWGVILFIKKILKNKNSVNEYAQTLSVLIIIVVSALYGNVIICSAIGIFISCIFNISYKKHLLIASYSLDIGGIEKSLVTLVKNLNYKKYQITILLERKKGIYLEKIPKEIKILEYKANESKNKIIRKLINATKRIKWLLFNYHQYDASICYATYSLPCGFIARTSSKNSMMIVHSNYKYVYKINELLNFFDNRKIVNYGKIIFVSNESMNDLIYYYPEIKTNSIVINNLVDYQEILNESEKQIEIKKKKNTFLFLGRLDESSKKVSRIIEVANNLKSNNSVEFWIIGDGPNKVEYKKMISKYKLSNIKMLGAKQNPYPYIKKCDYLILTSDYEGFPVVYNEAIVLNKPILTTIDVSDEKISIPNRFGIIMEKNVEDITKTINEVLDKEFKIVEKINFEQVNRERIKLLEKIIDEVI